MADLELEGEYACRIAFSQRCNDGTEQVEETSRERVKGKERQEEPRNKLDEESRRETKRRSGRGFPRGRSQRLTGGVWRPDGEETTVTLMEPDRLNQVSNRVSAEEERRRNHSAGGVRGGRGIKGRRRRRPEVEA